MVDKKLSEFSSVSKSEVSDLVVLYNNGTSIRNGKLAISALDDVYASLTGNNTFSGNVTFNNPVIATVSRATADSDGNSIKNTYATKEELNNKSTFSLFHDEWFGYQLNDPSWLKADTFSWQDGTVYSNAYNHLVDDIDGSILKTEKINDTNEISAYGNVVSSNGILNGFIDSEGYATHTAKKPTTSFEYVIKCRHEEWTGTAESIVYSPESAKGGILLRIMNTNGVLNLWVGGTSSWTLSGVNVNFSMPKKTWVWLKMAWDGTTFTFSNSLDGITYEETYSIALADTKVPDWSLYNCNNLGGSTWQNYAFSNGSIDLNECYLKIDGDIYWRGCTYKTLEYYEATDGHKIALANSDSIINSLYEDGKYTDYYILDTTNQRFKLPRIKNRTIIESINNGNVWYRLYSDGWVEQGGIITSSGTTGWKHISVFLPKKMRDTTYTISWLNAYTQFTEESSVVSSKSTEAFTIPQMTTYQEKASWRVTGYVDNSVLPKIVKYHYYYVGQYTLSAIAQTAGLNTELFNGKMDLDMSNMNPSQTAKQTIIRLSEPDWSAGVDIEVPVQATPYVCPSDGVYVANFMHSGGNNRTTYLYVNGVKTSNCLSNSDSNNRNKASISVMLKKDDSIYFDYGTTTSNTMASTFYPLKGVTNA